MRKQLFIIILLFFYYSGVISQTKSFSPVQTNERRIALVIGNKDYEFVSRLKNPVNDAIDITASLKRLGFEVVMLQNADYRAMSSSWNTFVSQLNSSDVVMLYYSGHGASYNGKNYLLPIDAKITCLEQIEEYGISLNRITVDLLSQRVKNSFIFLDACRNLPTMKICNGNFKDLTTQAGLVRPTNNPRGSMIVYATREGSTADDNPGQRNGAFTGALLKYLETPNVGIRGILDNTFDEVEKRTLGRQIPGRYDELKGDFIFIKSVIPIKKNTEDIKQVAFEPEKKTKKDLLPFEPDIVFVKGGAFKMGNSLGSSDEKIEHSVTLSDFFIGKYEITQAQWNAIMNYNPSYFNDCNECPVEGVSWDEVQVYLQKLNKLTRKKYRLPTEAEWEYAARGGYESVGYKYSGGEIANVVGWVGENSNNRTHKVGQKSANELQIFDMTGNVWEWCSDWKATYDSSSVHNPQGPEKGIYRVLRGGSWYSNTQSSNVTHRNFNNPDSRNNYYGFRICLN